MAITVKSNTAVNNALNQLGKTTRALSRNFEKISSGLRIARAADDAAGLGVAENLKAAHSSADVAARNINDGISVVSVAEGASAEVVSILTRLRELAIQSASETLANTERAYINDEASALLSEIDRIANVTEFNGTLLTDGTNTSLDVQVGINDTADNQIAITLGDLNTDVIGTGSLGTIDLATSTGALAALSEIDAAIDSVSSYRSDYGAIENRLNNALNNIETFSEATKAAESAIRDADFGQETANLTSNQILQQAGVSVLSQAKNLPQSALTLLQG